jgi:hypothetical protein
MNMKKISNGSFGESDNSVIWMSIQKNGLKAIILTIHKT